MKRERKNRNDSGFWRICLKAVLLGVAVTAGCILLFAAVLLIPRVSRGLAAPFATVSLAAGAFCMAWYLAGKSGQKGYLVGAACGGSGFVLITVLSLLLGGGAVTLHTLFRLVILLLSGTVGGIFGVNRFAKHSYSVS